MKDKEIIEGGLSPEEFFASLETAPEDSKQSEIEDLIIWKLWNELKPGQAIDALCNIIPFIVFSCTKTVGDSQRLINYISTSVRGCVLELYAREKDDPIKTMSNDKD